MNSIQNRVRHVLHVRKAADRAHSSKGLAMRSTLASYWLASVRPAPAGRMFTKAKPLNGGRTVEDYWRTALQLNYLQFIARGRGRR